MPKQKITREMVVEAAFELARKKGLERVIVKDIAENLGCSVQPIYSYCKNMDGLRKDVMEKADGFLKEYICEHADQNDFFRSTGYAYIQLAKEEPNVFKMFLMNERGQIHSFDELYESETNPQVAQFIANNLKISISGARTLHLNMLIYNVGMGAILANTTPGIGQEEVHKQMEMVYQAFLDQVVKDEKQVL